MKRLQRVPEQHTTNSRVKAAASLEGLDAMMTDDFIAAPFNMVSHITIALDLSPGWHRAWHSPFLCLHGRRDPGWLGGITILKVMLLTGTRPGALLTPSTAQTSRSVGVLTAIRIVHCFAYFLIHKLTNSGFLRTTQRTVPTRQLPPMQESIYYRFFKARCEREYKHT